MVTRQVKRTIREKPAWEGRAREAARQLGILEGTRGANQYGSDPLA